MTMNNEMNEIEHEEKDECIEENDVININENQYYTLDEVLEKFSYFSRYHLVTMLLLFLAYGSNSINSTNYIFAAEEVKRRCKNPFDNITCDRIDSTICTEWVYDPPHSFVAEYDLGCEDWKRTFVGTAHNFGYMVGLPFMGLLSDRLGRKKAIVILGFAGGILGLVKSISPWYWFYIVMEFLKGAIGDNFSPVYILTIEVVESKKRPLYFALASLGIGVGTCLMAFIASEVQYWRTFLKVLYAPSLLLIFYICLLDESPRWLLNKGKKQEAVAILKKAAKKSKLELDINEIDNVVCEEEKEMALSKLLKAILASKTLLLRFFVCTFWWITALFVNFGMSINSVSLQGNKYINFVLISMSEGPGTFIIMFILTKYKRKKPLMTCFFAGAAFCILQPFLPLSLPWLSVLIYAIGKLLSSFYFNITCMYTSELFPTHTRNLMQALCSSLGRIGSIIAPQTPLLMVYWSGLPMMAFGGAAFIAGLSTFLVPDTADDSLPDTVRQAEEIGVKKSNKHEIKNLIDKEIRN